MEVLQAEAVVEVEEVVGKRVAFDDFNGLVFFLKKFAILSFLEESAVAILYFYQQD